MSKLVFSVGSKPPSTASTGTLRVNIKHVGNSPIFLRAKLVDDRNGAFKLLHVPKQISGNAFIEVAYFVPPDTTQETPNTTQEAPDTTQEVSATLCVETDNAPRISADLWDPRPWLDSKDVARLSVRRIKPAFIKLQPSVLWFHSGCTSRVVEVCNQGDMPTNLAMPYVSSDFDVRLETPDEGWAEGNPIYLGAHSSRRFLVKRVNPRAQDGLSFEVCDLERRTLAKAQVRSKPARKGGAVPRFVIGIDFGTSNTSIVVRDTVQGGVEMLPYPYDGDAPQHWDLLRFPTMILLKGPTRRDWDYGYRAVEAYSPNTTCLVEEIKTLLRQTDEPFLSFHGCKVDTIVAWYFRELLDNIIRPYLKSKIGEAEAAVQFVFSLPVLDMADGGALYKLQEERTRKAAEAAGYHEMGEVMTIEEPIAAALYLLSKDYQKKVAQDSRIKDLKEGDSVYVFDSGGGTTDIASFRVQIKHDQFEMLVTGQLGSHIVEVDGEQVQQQFGGTVVTKELGFRVWWFYANREEKPFDFLPFANSAEGEQRRADPFDEFDALYVRKDDHTLTIKRDDQVEEGARKPYAWYHRFPSLYRDVEEDKKAVANLPSESDSVPLSSAIDAMMSEYDDSDFIKVERRAVDKVVDIYVSNLIRQIESTASSGQFKYLYVVGGNTKLTRLTEALKHAFPRKVVTVDDDDRNYAVCKGTVYTFDAYAACSPYLVTVISEDNKKLLSLGPNHHQTDQKILHLVRIEPGGSHELSVMCESSALGAPDEGNETAKPALMELLHKVVIPGDPQLESHKTITVVYENSCIKIFSDETEPVLNYVI